MATITTFNGFGSQTTTYYDLRKKEHISAFKEDVLELLENWKNEAPKRANGYWVDKTNKEWDEWRSYCVLNYLIAIKGEVNCKPLIAKVFDKETGLDKLTRKEFFQNYTYCD